MIELLLRFIVASMVTHIRQGSRPHLYIMEWREHLGLTPKQLAERLEVDRTTLWRWETGSRRVKPETQVQIAAALGIAPAALWRLPQTRPSLDDMLKDAPDELFDTAADIVRRLTKRAS